PSNVNLGGRGNSLQGVGSSGQQVTIDGKIITPATLEKGEKVKVSYGNWWPESFESWEKPLGTISVYLFVFKSLEEAKQLMDQYNLLAPGLQEKFWF
ncbi:MAG: hypothetical protein RR614_08300, partial [Eubacterium sp.]